jgi:sugar phosphate isomerase/epimerase
MRLAFSTVACPDWTLREVASFAEEAGYLGVELRTFGSGSTQFACDPALTDPAKTRGIFAQSGCQFASVATSISYDAPVSPPLLGHILGGTPLGVRQTAWAVDLAARLEAPLVRVFAFQVPGRDSRASAIARIVDRLELAVAIARNTGVRLAIENGGSFTTATAISDLLDRVNSPLLGAAYCPAIAQLDGEDPVGAINVLGERLFCVKLKELREGAPCALGEGSPRTRAFVTALAESGFTGWAVYEYDRAWLPAAADLDPRPALRTSARTYFDWARGAGPESLVDGRVMVVR